MAVRLNPNFARTYYDRAIAYSLKGDHNAAIRDNTEAIRRQDPTMEADFYFNRAVSYHAIGSTDKAMADFNEAIRLAPKDLRTYCGRASTFEDMGELNKASADYDQATRYNATEASDYVIRGTAHFSKGNYRAAASDFEKATRLSPRDYDALLSLAWFQATCPEDSLRNATEALEKAKRACELSRWQHSDALDALAAAYAEIGKFDDAVKYQTQAINMKVFTHSTARKCRNVWSFIASTSRIARNQSSSRTRLIRRVTPAGSVFKIVLASASAMCSKPQLGSGLNSPNAIACRRLPGSADVVISPICRQSIWLPRKLNIPY